MDKTLGGGEALANRKYCPILKFLGQIDKAPTSLVWMAKGIKNLLMDRNLSTFGSPNTILLNYCQLELMVLSLSLKNLLRIIELRIVYTLYTTAAERLCHLPIAIYRIDFVEKALYCQTLRLQRIVEPPHRAQTRKLRLILISRDIRSERA